MTDAIEPTVVHPEDLAEWQKLARVGRLDDAIVEYVRRMDWVSFPELERNLKPYLDCRGDWALTTKENSNVIFWCGMSRPFFDLISGLLTAQRVHLHQASMLTYMIDGGMLKMPLVKSVKPYKTPHWLPVCLRVVPLEPEKKPSKRGKS